MAGAIIDSTSQHWNTPPELAGVALDILHIIDLDPCSNAHSFVPAARRCCGGPGDDGLLADWTGRRVFVNPPYGRGIGAWIRKAALAGPTANVLMLIPAAVEIRAWRSWVWPWTSRICFLAGRPKFWLDGRPSKRGITRAVAFVLFGHGSAMESFDRVCRPLGEIVVPAEHARCFRTPTDTVLTGH